MLLTAAINMVATAQPSGYLGAQTRLANHQKRDEQRVASTNENRLVSQNEIGTVAALDQSKVSISSNETVIANDTIPNGKSDDHDDQDEQLELPPPGAAGQGEGAQQKHRTTTSGKSAGGRKGLKSLFISFAGQHWNLFNGQHAKKPPAAAGVEFDEMPTCDGSIAQQSCNKSTHSTSNGTTGDSKYNSNLFLAFAQKYLNLNFSSSNQVTTSTRHQQASRSCQSCPATPIRQQRATEDDNEMEAEVANKLLANGLQQAAAALDQHADGDLEANSASTTPTSTKPSVRFVESAKGNDNAEAQQQQQQQNGCNVSGRRFLSRHLRCTTSDTKQQVKFAECGVQTSDSVRRRGNEQEQQQQQQCARNANESESASTFLSGPFVEDDAQRAKLVERLFELSPTQAPVQGEDGKQQLQPPPAIANDGKPMDSSQFRESAYKLVDYICNYLDTIRERRVTPINIEPGYLKSLIEPAAPEHGEPFSTIMRDFEEKIMCGITHWQHPHFHAYFPAGNAYPSILADMLGDALGCVGFSWAASPAYTELEIIMLDWMGKMIGLPDDFLCLSSSGSGSSRGGGVIQGSASECVLVNLLAARHWAMDKLRQKYPGVPDGMLLSKLIGYCSKEAHSCVEKAAMIGFIRMRALDTDERHSLRGETLARAIEVDRAAGLEPFIVCATLGTTSCVSFDNLKELGQVCQANDDLWLHVDAAYAGSALICPEFKYLIEGIELATSFNMNPNKWLLINFDCSLMWVRDRFKLTRAFVVDPLYLQHSFSDQAIDYRHWGIPLSRRFRALKLWFVIRNYGIEGLRAYVRNHVRLAKLFASLIEQDKRFCITNEVTLGLVCFRLVGSNALNQRLLSMINASGKLHMVPASLNGRYVIRFCVCDQNAQERDIHYAYENIAAMASELFELIRAGKERIRAISQQNTIDVSSISLHTQQSASADRLSGGEPATGTGMDVGEQQVQQQSASTARHVLRRSSRHDDSAAEQPQQQPSGELTSGSATSAALRRSPLMKQVSVQQQQRTNATTTTTTTPDEQVECEGEPTGDYSELEMMEDEDEDDEILALDELEADLLELEDEDGGELELGGGDSQSDLAKQQQGGDSVAGPASKLTAEQLRALMNDSISPIQRGRLSRSSGKSSRSYSRGATTTATSNANQPELEDDEAADELVKLIDKRNRMSLRYKREFFVRVVSDPRVYRASISGDINAHASTTSLGSSSGQQQPVASTTTTTTTATSEASSSSIASGAPAAATTQKRPQVSALARHASASAHSTSGRQQQQQPLKPK